MTADGQDWQAVLRHDPLSTLIESGNQAIELFVRHEFLDDKNAPISEIVTQPEVMKLLRRQLPDGSFKFTGKKADLYPPHHYPLLETWKQMRYLVDQYGLTREHPAVASAAEYLFSCQTSEGDFRGFIGNQYATYYTGAVLSLLVKADYGGDARVKKAFDWLLCIRQDDGAWSLPMLTAGLSYKESSDLCRKHSEPIQGDSTKPFSHNVTGMVLRAFAAHPDYRNSDAAHVAALLLISRFFKPDAYTSYRSPHYWTEFQFPYWWNHLIAALDSISWIGISPEDEDVSKGIDWLIENQSADGLWLLSNDPKKKRLALPAKAKEMQLWLSLAVCRVLKRFFLSERL